MSDKLICPYCGKEQYTHEPDDISALMCLTTCEHCCRSFWYAVTVTREYEARRDKEADRYQVITYNTDEGADEKMEYQSLEVAEQAAKEYIDGEGGIFYEGAIVYDLKERRIVLALGHFPDSERPAEGVAE